jgi:hypothetical protein
MTDDEALKLQPGAFVRLEQTAGSAESDKREIYLTVMRIEPVAEDDESATSDRLKIHLSNGDWRYPKSLVEVVNLSRFLFSDTADEILFDGVRTWINPSALPVDLENVKKEMFGRIEPDYNLTVYLPDGKTIVIPHSEWDYRQ